MQPHQAQRARHRCHPHQSAVAQWNSCANTTPISQLSRLPIHREGNHRLCNWGHMHPPVGICPARRHSPRLPPQEVRYNTLGGVSVEGSAH